MKKVYWDIGVDTEQVRHLLSRLEDAQLQNQALKKAVAATAKQARESLASKAQESYTVKNAGFKKAMRIRTSSGRAPASIIRSEGEPLPLNRFKVSRGRKAGVKAQVVKPGSLKRLERGGIKAFVNNIAARGQVRRKDTKKGKAGSAVRHIAVAQRAGKERLEINEKFSNSIPVMLGSSERVYGIVQPHIAADLQENLRRFVDEAMGRK